MANKTITTRIKNKVASIGSWNSSSVNNTESNIRLLDGEIAIVRVPTGDTYTNPVTGVSEPVFELLMKVGDGTSVFSALPWLSAKASDVYEWAKTPDAKDVKVKVKKGTDTTATENTLETWLKSVYDKGVDNATLISGLDTIVDKLDGDDTVDGSVKKLIKAAIENLDALAEIGSGNFVKAVTQIDGKIQVTKGTIAEFEVPSISTDKVYLASADSTTLTAKLADMDTKIAANSTAAGHEHPYLPDTTMWAKGATQGGAAESANKVNKSLTVKLSSGSTEGTNLFTFDGSAAKTIDVTPSAIGAATYASVFGDDGNGGINAQVQTNKTDIANLRTSIAGGVHFRGTVAAEPTADTVKVNDYDVKAGTIVIYSGKEYICSKVEDGVVTWEQLGDVTRIGEISTAVDNLDKAIKALDETTTNKVADTHKFVSQVTQEDGKIAVTYTQPTSADVTHDTGTVDTKFASIDTEVAKLSDISANDKVGATISSKITAALEALDYNTSTKAVTATATTFIESITQENGKIKEAVRKTLPTASAGNGGGAGTAGIVALIDSTSSESKTAAATANAVKTAYDKADSAHTLASGKAAIDHAHGNITKDGTITSTAVTSATGVLVYDSNNKIQRATAAQTRTIIGAAESDHNHNNTYVRHDVNTQGLSDTQKSNARTNIGAAAADHNHNNDYADKQEFANVQSTYVRFNTSDNKLYVGSTGTEEIIFDCGGAPV